MASLKKKKTPLSRRQNLYAKQGQRKTPFKREGILSRTWFIRWDLPAKGQLGEGRKEEGCRTDLTEDRERRGTNILSKLNRKKYIHSNYPVAGELRIICTYIMAGTLLIHALQR